MKNLIFINRELLGKNLKLGRLHNGWIICDLLNEPKEWEKLAKVLAYYFRKATHRSGMTLGCFISLSLRMVLCFFSHSISHLIQTPNCSK